MIQRTIYLRTGRVEALSDGIFAIAMTILILSFEGVVVSPGPAKEPFFLPGMLSELWPDFLHYVISFVILGSLWIQHHHQLHFVKHVNTKFLFINIFALMFIALIPFSTVIASDYGHIRTGSIVFELNLLIAGLIFFGHWVYATDKHRLVDPDLDPYTIDFYKKRNLITPVVSVAAICFSLVLPRWGTLLYLLIPVILMMHKSKK